MSVGRIQDVKVLAKILATEPPPMFYDDQKRMYSGVLDYLQRCWNKFSGLNIASTIINESPTTIINVISESIKRCIAIVAVEFSTDVSTGVKAYLPPIPEILDGYNLIRAQAGVITPGTTNATTIGILNVTDSHEILSNNISIASGETIGTPGTINASYDDVATNDILRIHVDAVSSTAPKGLNVVLEFEKP